MNTKNLIDSDYIPIAFKEMGKYKKNCLMIFRQITDFLGEKLLLCTQKHAFYILNK